MPRVSRQALRFRLVPGGRPPRDPATPLWWGTIVLRVITLLFAIALVAADHDGYRRPWLAMVVILAMTGWTVLTSVAYARRAWRRQWLVALDVLLTCGLMLTSPLVLSDAQYAAAHPLITTVWVAAPAAASGARFGMPGGALAGLALAAGTAGARMEVDLDVLRDGVLLTATGLLIGMTATTARRSQAMLARAMRTEAATAERERLARSIHDSVLQVLARVRKRGAELGGEAAELATQAGEQEIALRSLVSTQPAGPNGDDTADLRSALQLLATSRVQVSSPAGEVRLPGQVVAELTGVVGEALANVERHAGPGARAWVLLEELGEEVVVTVRDDGPGIPEGRLETAATEGRLGVVTSIRGRVADLGGTISLETAPGEGTEWEVRLPKPGRRRGAR
ncbi:MacS family sensor histidine kinase [Amycolatopsis cihanbeyliensis]|uniref:MacS family sensor histidine kinase n=1 Tax=Amycolatopsis cihanbeyliensis TaxID=1128664 RepID=UPI001FE7E4A8|nr:ATP-binding protein [Amycolatopsis cihanbeyliensis]